MQIDPAIESITRHVQTRKNAMMEYHAAYFEGHDGWVVAKVLDFPGAVSQGKTLQAARRMLRDALRLLAEAHLEMGQALPPPNPRSRDKKAIFREKIPISIRVPMKVPS